MEGKLTLIMQNYNTPKDILFEAIDSVLRQTCKEFDFVFIDDWSTKYNTSDFFNEWKDIWHKREYKGEFHTVIKPQDGPNDERGYNHGHSFCRNWGLDLVNMQRRIDKKKNPKDDSEDYVMFMDSDDILAPYAIDILLDAFKKEPQTDISIGNFTRAAHSFYRKVDEYWDLEYLEGVSYRSFSNLESLNVLCDPYMLPKHKLSAFSVPFCATWNKIFRRSLFDTVRFPDYRTKDDNYTAHRLLWQARKVTFTNEITYFYRPGGTLADTNLYKTIDIAKAHEDRVNFFKKIFKDEYIHDKNFNSNLLKMRIVNNENLVYLFTLMQVAIGLPEVKDEMVKQMIYTFQENKEKLMLTEPEFSKKVIEFVRGK